MFVVTAMKAFFPMLVRLAAAGILIPVVQVFAPPLIMLLTILLSLAVPTILMAVVVPVEEPLMTLLEKILR